MLKDSTFRFIFVLFSFFLMVIAKQSFAAANKISDEENKQKSILTEWFALGSGCRAKQNLPGNVRMEELPFDNARPNSHRFKFHFDDYGINEKTVDQSILKFARECAIRASITPPAGKKITNVIAETNLKTFKDKGTILNNLVTLKLGATVLSEKLAILTSNEMIPASEEHIVLVHGKGSDEKMPEMTCAEPKIAGVDFSFIAARSSPQYHPMAVTLGGDRSLIIEITLSDC